MAFVVASGLNNDAQKIADRIVRRLMRGEMLSSISDSELTTLLIEARNVLTTESAFITLEAPVAIYGDIHGQFKDMLRFLAITGTPPDTQLLFLGDYVDRCTHSLEVISLLLSFKILYPTRIHLLRGNHECSKMNRVYGFYEEIRRKRSIPIWCLFTEVFSELPLCALVSERILCMHGGLSPRIKSWEDLKCLQKPRTQKECDEGLALDLMWADPANDCCAGFKLNKARATSWCFGDDVVEDICRKLRIDLVVRAHEVVPNGHELRADNRLCTIFSAPFYCGTGKNAASVMQVTADLAISFETIRPRPPATPITPIEKERLRRIAKNMLVRSPMPQHHATSTSKQASV